MRVAVLYSGRWFGGLLSRVWIEHQLNFVVRPNHATVFVVADTENWCEAPDEARAELAARTSSGRRIAEAIFQHDVQVAWSGWDDVHATLLPDVSTQAGPPINQAYRTLSQRLNQSHGLRMGHYMCELMVRWYYQYEHVAHAVALSMAHGSFDWLIRSRLDMVLNRPLDLSRGWWSSGDDRPAQNDQRSPSSVRADAAGSIYALSFRGLRDGDAVTVRECRVARHHGLDSPQPAACEIYYRDWLYVGTPMAMTALANMTRRAQPGDLPLTDLSLRCFGWCQEEQVELQLRRVFNISLVPLPGGLEAHVDRIPVGASISGLKPAKGCSAACPGARRCLRSGLDYSYVLTSSPRVETYSRSHNVMRTPHNNTDTRVVLSSQHSSESTLILDRL